MFATTLTILALASTPSPTELGEAHRSSADLIAAAHVSMRLKRRFARPTSDGAKEKQIETTYGGEFWYRNRLVRGAEDTDAGHTEWIQRENVEYFSGRLRFGDGTVGISAGKHTVKQSAHYLDAWSYALFTLDNLKIDEYFAANRRHLSVTSASLGDVKCFVVTADPATSKYKMEFWIDPAVNHLVRAMYMVMDDGSRVEAEVITFREHQPGLFFPEQMARRYRPGASAQAKGARPWDEQCTIKAEINCPIDDTVFRIRYPSGATFIDSMSRTAYTVDADGRRTGPVRALVGDSNDAQPLEHARSAHSSDSANTRWWAYTLALSIVGLGLSLAVKVRSRRSNQH